MLTKDRGDRWVEGDRLCMLVDQRPKSLGVHLKRLGSYSVNTAHGPKICWAFSTDPMSLGALMDRETHQLLSYDVFMRRTNGMYRHVIPRGKFTRATFIVPIVDITPKSNEPMFNGADFPPLSPPGSPIAQAKMIAATAATAVTPVDGKMEPSIVVYSSVFAMQCADFAMQLPDNATICGEMENQCSTFCGDIMVHLRDLEVLARHESRHQRAISFQIVHETQGQLLSAMLRYESDDQCFRLEIQSYHH